MTYSDGSQSPIELRLAKATDSQVTSQRESEVYENKITQYAEVHYQIGRLARKLKPVSRDETGEGCWTE